MLAPCGAKTGAISVFVDVNLRICVRMHRAHRFVFLCISCLCICSLCACGFRGGHNEMGG